MKSHETIQVTRNSCSATNVTNASPVAAWHAEPTIEIAPHYDWIVRWLERWFLADCAPKLCETLPANARTLEIGAGTGLNFVFYPAGASGVASEPSTRHAEIRAPEKPARQVSVWSRVAPSFCRLQTLLSTPRLRRWSFVRWRVPPKRSPNCGAWSSRAVQSSCWNTCDREVCSDRCSIC